MQLRVGPLHPMAERREPEPKINLSWSFCVPDQEWASVFHPLPGR